MRNIRITVFLGLLGLLMASGAGAEPEPSQPVAPTLEEKKIDPEPQDEGPELNLPPEVEQTTKPGLIADPAQLDLLRGLQEARFARAKKTSIGGYGELHFNMEMDEGGGGRENEIDLHRLVLFIAHNFNERFRFYTELEFEHAFFSKDDGAGQFGIEQAYIDWRLLTGDALNLRAGIILIPMGIINQWHEPNIFHGVERPMVDKVIIPTTWREAGIGIWGEPVEGFRYEFYIMSGLDADGFNLKNGIRGGRQHVSEATAEGPAFTLRLEHEAVLGMITGLSLYTGWTQRRVEGLNSRVNVTGVSGDWRIRKKGWEARALIVYFHINNTAKLRQEYEVEEGPPAVTEAISDVSSALLGAYAELGYDILFCHSSEHQLVPFVRVEYYDTSFNKSGTDNAPGFVDIVTGLSYRPIPQLVFKTDFIVRRPSTGQGSNIWNAGVGWAF